MNEQFRVAHKLGLMFRPGAALPEDIKSWATAQLHSKSPALGIEKVGGKVQPWPRALQPNLEKRIEMWTLFRLNRKKAREKIEGQDSPSAIWDNEIKNLMGKKDELKFSHRNIYGEDQVRLRFMSFWTNHFTMGNIFDNETVIGHAMDEAILANLNGTFSEMLYKVTSHPGMLVYLDNIWSSGENSKHARDSRRDGFQAGLNDNLGRELLELHSVSPAAKYTETDVRNSAKVLAGWGSYLEATPTDIKNQGADTTNHWDMYKKHWAEPGNKSVMGKTIYAGKGGLRQLTDFLSAHENTIMYISTKLSQHLVSDEPSTSDINYIAKAWRQSNGNLDKIHTAVIERAILSKEPKFQWPMTWLFQVLRLSEATFIHGWDELYKDSNIFNRLMRSDKIFEELGQSFWSTRQPNGYSNKKEEWLSGEMFERRIRFADAIYRAGNPKISSAEIMSRIGANMSTRKLVDSATSGKDKFISLMCSPELMGLESV